MSARSILSVTLCASLFVVMGVACGPAAKGKRPKSSRSNATAAKPSGKADAPKADAPKADAPKADAPKADAPKADAPKADAPKADAPKADAPKADAPKADAPKADAPKADAPKADAPKADAPKADAPKADAPPDTPEKKNLTQGNSAAEGRPVSSPDQTETVLLGTPSLTAGIPGEGVLTKERIQAWLAKPENHVALSVELPLGLSQASANIQIPADNPLTRAKIELGRQLYFDARLSADGMVSCASCHSPDEGYARHTQFGEGIKGQKGGRNSPVSYNRILTTVQFWDGRAGSLEEQAKGPIANPIEMGNTHEKAVETVKSLEGYRLQFERIFGAKGITIDTIAKAIASFERVLVTGPAPADYFETVRTIGMQYPDADALAELKEENPKLFERYQAAVESAKAMGDDAKRGRELFFGKAQCSACHAGANFTDEQFHNIGVGMDKTEPDLGRFAISKKEKETGAFKTPTLRNVEHTAPYMHDGGQATLEEVIAWYDKGGHPNPFLSDKMKKLSLSEQEKKDLLAYMKSLTGAFPTVAKAGLPQ